MRYSKKRQHRYSTRATRPADRKSACPVPWQIFSSVRSAERKAAAPGSRQRHLATRRNAVNRSIDSVTKRQALLDEQALLSCMAYVDLNPVRASMAETPEQSDHTSVQHRIKHWQQQSEKSNQTADQPDHPDHACQPNNLLPFAGNLHQPMPKDLIFNLADYLELVDWTGRQIREDKVGAISAQAEPILKRLSISPEHWVYLCTSFESRFKGLVGCVHSLEQACQAFKRHRRPNLSNSTTLFT